VTAPARLLSVRLQGFKSFAERTLVTFGPGISAIVGPNGSGKSNLADALRWALGEQGRALRSRKAEDVIWAGSERRAAVGLADVQLTLDNADGLLALDYGVIEFGRRLYRSGENEYLLNRQRVRLKDLVDLLDAAHLAENAFLFIGQGTVDQALALRPEERRPLFEEVAGVRRHERRRRRAEEQLAESEANLARVEDVLAELRPQVRRLAAQAEQQSTRLTAGDELVSALLVAAHARWHEAAAGIARAEAELLNGRAVVDAALDELAALEAASSAATVALEERARAGATLRSRADDARLALTSAQLEAGRVAGERESVEREHRRLADERALVEADLAVQRRRVAEPLPNPDPGLQVRLASAEHELSAAIAELATLEAAGRAGDADEAAIRRVRAARNAEADIARRQLAALERQASDEAAQVTEAGGRVSAAQRIHDAQLATLESLTAAETRAGAAREAAAADAESAHAVATAAAEHSGLAAAAVAAARARSEAAAAAMEDDQGGFAARMRARGARRLDDGVDVDPSFRAAIDAALAGAGRAYLTTRGGLLEHASERGIAIVVDDVELSSNVGPPGAIEDIPAVFRRRVTDLGGGFLHGTLRRDGSGAVARLLERTVWLPDFASALAVQAYLPPGWVAVPRDGSAVVGEVVVRLGTSEGVLERRAQLDLVQRDLKAAERTSAEASSNAAAAAQAATASRAALDAARAAEAAATSERRRGEEDERIAARRLEAVSREAAWHDAQVERLRAAVARASASLPDAIEPGAASVDPGETEAIGTLRARVAEWQARRERLADEASDHDRVHREADRRRAAAEAAIAIDEARLAAAGRAGDALADRERVLDGHAAALASRLADAVVHEAQTRQALADLAELDAADRARLGEAERASAAARDRLRSAEEVARVAEHHDLEARLGLESLREQVLVELAGLGNLSLRHLTAATNGAGEPTVTETVDTAIGNASGDESDDMGELAAELDRVAAAWASTTPARDLPGPGRLASLRRRYHELGAVNPFALDEYATVRARLDELEAQHDDLRAAIGRTRGLIGELDAMISEQFRSTFATLETRFDARFRQLFGGGFARLTLTDPTDLAATGVEIVARPPGKKAQALAMLSGGERALTAVALLFAMLEVRPVPFCVLDEVDAALDEANVGRFTAALRELARTTQFVVITHNRGTIEIADALYGVTAGDDSVSRVISLRLDEATELAERGRTAVPVGPGQGAV